MAIVFTAVVLLVPAAILWLTRRYSWAARIGVIVLCYVAGLAAGNSGLIPRETLPLREGISEAAVALALPMLLFTLDIRSWRSVAGRALLSMLLATTSVVALATSLFFAFRSQGAETAGNLAAMSVGVYTGGTPNLAAIKAGLDIPHGEYILFHSLDTVVGAGYMLAMLTVGVPLFRRILGRPTGVVQNPVDRGQHPGDDDFRPLLDSSNRAQLAPDRRLERAGPGGVPGIVASAGIGAHAGGRIGPGHRLPDQLRYSAVFVARGTGKCIWPTKPVCT